LQEQREIGTRFIERARRLFRTTRDLTAGDRFVIPFSAKVLLDDAAVALERDPVSALLILSEITAWAPEAAFLWRGLWTTSAKCSLREIAQLSPVLHAWLVAMLDSNSTVSARLDAAKSYFTELFGPGVFRSTNIIGPKTYKAPVNDKLLVSGAAVPGLRLRERR
jgi:hypothetical protein